MRNAKIEQYLHKVDTDAEEKLKYMPECLKDGYRTLFMLERHKDGGHNKEEKRVFNFAVTDSPESLLMKYKEFLWLRYYWDKELRIYLSVNSRDPHRTVRNMLQVMIDSQYSDAENKDLVAKKMLKGSRPYIMNPNARDSRNFLFDVDDIEGRDVMGETLQEMGDLGVEEIYRTKTKNGWHIVTKPFNKSLWKGVAEIKTDGLLLLDY